MYFKIAFRYYLGILGIPKFLGILNKYLIRTCQNIKHGHIGDVAPYCRKYRTAARAEYVGLHEESVAYATPRGLSG